MEQEKTMHLRDYWFLVRRRAKIIIFVCAICVGFAGFKTFTATPLYQASAKLLVTTPYTPVSDPTMLGIMLYSRGRSVETQMAAILTEPVAREVIKRLNLRENPKELLDMLDTNNIKDSDVIQITATGKDPRLVAEIADTTAAVYIDDCLRYDRRSAKMSREFFASQLPRFKKELDNAEAAFHQFKIENEISNPAELAGRISNQMSSAMVRINQLRGEMVASQARIQSLQDQLVGMPSTKAQSYTESPSMEIYQVKQLIATARIELEGARQKYNEDHPRIKELLGRIQEGEKRLKEAEKVPVMTSRNYADNPLYSNLTNSLAQSQAEYASRKADLAAWEATYSEAAAMLKSFPKIERTYNDLERRVRTAEKNYLIMQEKLQSFEIAETTTLGNVRTLENARVPQRPFYPNKKLTIAFAMIVGLILGLGLAAVVDFMDDTYKEPDDVQRHLQLTTLGLIPIADRSEDALVVGQTGHSARAEAFRILRSNIAFTAIEVPLSTLLVASAQHGDGKTSIVANLGVIMAMEGKRVIIVDADLRRPALHRMFNLPNSTGLTSVLLGDMSIQDALQDTQVEGLSILASGPLPPNPAELLSSQKMREVVKTLYGFADVVIFDSPPCAAVTDAAILASLVDGTVLVVAAGVTRRETAIFAKQLLEKAMARIPGVVLNKADVEKYGRDLFYLYSETEHVNGTRKWLKGLPRLPLPGK